jgi:acetyl-CoA C-acetyltransferase
MKAVSMGVASIKSGNADVVVTGGMESMSNTPYYAVKSRFGSKYGHQELTDGIIKDGLFDVYNQYLMGNAAELCAEEHGFTRENQDDFAISSYQRAQKATSEGCFKDEIVPVEISNRGKSMVVSMDEDCLNVGSFPRERPEIK